MPGLSKCLKRAGLSKHEAAILRGNTLELRDVDGLAAQEAAIQAVEDYIETLEGERADIVKQIQDAGGEIAALKAEAVSFARNTTPGEPTQGISEDTLRAEMGKAFGERSLSLIGDVVVPVNKQSELPEHILSFVEDGDIVKGVYDPSTGKTYIVLENLEDKEVRGVILHEIGVHYGMRGMLGDVRYKVVVAQLERMRKAGSREVIAAHEQAKIQAADPSQVDEETIAYLVTNSAELPFVKRLISNIKAFLFRKFGILGDSLTATDIEALARASVLQAAIGDEPQFSMSGDVFFSRNTKPKWLNDFTPAEQEAFRKAGVWRPHQSIQDRAAGWTANWKEKIKQGIFDQVDPVKSLDYHAYVLLRMSKSAAGPLESVLLRGTVHLDAEGGAYEDPTHGGFIKAMQQLKGEHDRFFSWVIGNRAHALLGVDKENNLKPDEIKFLMTVNRGDMVDGTSRETTYARALIDLNKYNKSILDMAEKSGLIDGETRPTWEKEFYIPFYRLMEEDQTTTGPVKMGGAVNQYAFKTLKGGMDAIGDPLENIIKNWSHLLDATLKNQAALATLKAAEDAGVAVRRNSNDKNTVMVMEGGKRTYYEVMDPFILDAISSMSFTGFSGPAMEAMNKFKNWLTFGVTLSPTFRIRNVIRDSIAMIGTNPASYNALGNIKTGFALTKEGNPIIGQMIAGGGAIRFGSLESDHTKRLIDAGVNPDHILDSPAKVKAMMTKAYDWWMHTGDRSENMNRAALYKKLRDEGVSHLYASYAARDTMDFSMSGTWPAIRFLAQTVPFFNARLQGLYKLGRGAAEDPKRFGYVVGATMMASVALMLAYRDDPEWQKREDWDKDSYWWFKIGKFAFYIPKPFEIGAIASLAEAGLETFLSDELTAKQFASRVGAMVGQQLSMNPVPQVFKPMIETWANRDFYTDRPIETMGMEHLSPSQRIAPNTSVFAQLAGANGVISPVQIDHLVKGYFGWLGVHAVMATDLIARPGLGFPTRPEMRLDEAFVIGDFVKELPAYQSRYVTQLYQQATEVQQAMADYRAAQKIGDTEQAASIMEKKGDKLKSSKLYTTAISQLSEINQQIKLVQRREGDASEKRAKLDVLYDQRDKLTQLTVRRALSATQ